jgi:hypothetical protein
MAAQFKSGARGARLLVTGLKRLKPPRKGVRTLFPEKVPDSFFAGTLPINAGVRPLF